MLLRSEGAGNRVARTGIDRICSEGQNGVYPRSPAQPGIAADRFAREIVRFLKVSSSALAAAECQTVGPLTPLSSVLSLLWIR